MSAFSQEGDGRSWIERGPFFKYTQYFQNTVRQAWSPGRGIYYDVTTRLLPNEFAFEVCIYHNRIFIRVPGRTLRKSLIEAFRLPGLYEDDDDFIIDFRTALRFYQDLKSYLENVISREKMTDRRVPELSLLVRDFLLDRHMLGFLSPEQFHPHQISLTGYWPDMQRWSVKCAYEEIDEFFRSISVEDVEHPCSRRKTARDLHRIFKNLHEEHIVKAGDDGGLLSQFMDEKLGYRRAWNIGMHTMRGISASRFPGNVQSVLCSVYVALALSKIESNVIHLDCTVHGGEKEFLDDLDLWRRVVPENEVHLYDEYVLAIWGKTNTPNHPQHLHIHEDTFIGLQRVIGHLISETGFLDDDGQPHVHDPSRFHPLPHQSSSIWTVAYSGLRPSPRPVPSHIPNAGLATQSKPNNPSKLKLRTYAILRAYWSIVLSIIIGGVIVGVVFAFDV